ncbi:hypothetical protein AAG570_006636 [Ranatra chinensis]|uniref:Uncharacterized protein n=1 Tax=Ranatra chinensis TaxID=642074 RepID=A0ABD0ZFV6_9HEMI
MVSMWWDFFMLGGIFGGAVGKLGGRAVALCSGAARVDSGGVTRAQGLPQRAGPLSPVLIVPAIPPPRRHRNIACTSPAHHRYITGAPSPAGSMTAARPSDGPGRS